MEPSCKSSLWKLCITRRRSPKIVVHPPADNRLEAAAPMAVQLEDLKAVTPISKSEKGGSTIGGSSGRRLRHHLSKLSLSIIKTFTGPDSKTSQDTPSYQAPSMRRKPAPNQYGAQHGAPSPSTNPLPYQQSNAVVPNDSSDGFGTGQTQPISRLAPTPPMAYQASSQNYGQFQPQISAPENYSGRIIQAPSGYTDPLPHQDSYQNYRRYQPEASTPKNYTPRINQLPSGYTDPMPQQEKYQNYGRYQPDMSTPENYPPRTYQATSEYAGFPETPYTQEVGGIPDRGRQQGYPPRKYQATSGYTGSPGTPHTQELDVEPDRGRQQGYPPRTYQATSGYTGLLGTQHTQEVGVEPDQGRQQSGYDYSHPQAQVLVPTDNSASTFTGRSPPIPSKIALPILQPSAHSHLTKTQPQKLVEPSRPSPPQYPSPRSSSQPSPMAGARLSKASPSQSNLLSPSAQYSSSPSPYDPSVIQGRNRANSLAPPSGNFDRGSNRAVSSPVHSATPGSPYHSDYSGGSPDGRGEKRKSWLLGGRSRASSTSEQNHDVPVAWVVADYNRVSYNAQLLVNGDKIPELWDENGDTYVYLFPRSTGRGPSFKVPSSTISSSSQLMALAFGSTATRQRARSFDGRSSLSAEDASRYVSARKPFTPPDTPRTSVKDSVSNGSGESVSTLGESQRDGHLFFPMSSTNTSAPPEFNNLVSARNLFAFLTGQPLVGTRHASSTFKILSNIATQLQGLGFSNVDSSTFGESVEASVNFFIDDLKLANVTMSREKTIEGVVLGERLRSTKLYDECFSHVVGKYDAIRKMNSPTWAMISEVTRTRLERAHTDLERRQKLIQIRLSDCEFPSLFAGIAASTSSDESKHVNFRAWKSSFLGMKKFVLNYYKFIHGNWPPRASSKKNAFTESGFNRLVLKGLYHDFCVLYDLLVDRENPTTRSLNISEVPEITQGPISVTALRKMLAEYDRSEPPVQPPVPFDVPKIPTVTTIDASHPQHSLSVQDQANTRKLQEHEIELLLIKARNLDSERNLPFLKAFRDYEAREARGKSAQELADLRYGQWLLIYVVLNALPMLVVDATGCHHTSGVEYFLCLGPLEGVPWVEAPVEFAYYRVAGGQTTVKLPPSAIANSPDGIYRRSHCWIAAEKWLNILHPEDSFIGLDRHDSSIVEQDDLLSPLQEPALPFANQNPRPLSMESTGSGSGYGTTGSALAENFGGLGISPHTSRDSQGQIITPEQAKARSRSRSAHRRSLGFGLEQLPMPPEYAMSPGAKTSPPISAGGSRPMNSYMGAGSGMWDSSSDRSGLRKTSEGGGTGQTFEDILGSMPDNKKRSRLSFFGAK